MLITSSLWVALAEGSPVALSPCRSSWAEIAGALDGAEAAWGVEEESFRAGVATIRTRVACLTEPLVPAEAARLHRVLGLAAWLERDVEGARAAFAAARAADPSFDFPLAMVPAANPVRRLYESAVPSEATTLIPPARGAKILLDGDDSRAIPSSRAVLFQLTTGSEARSTTWLLPGTPLPAYPKPGEGLRLPLLVGAGAAAAGGIALLALAGSAAADETPPTSQADLDARVGAKHAFAIAGGGLGVVAVGLGATAFIAGRW